MLRYIRGLSVRPSFYAPYNDITFIVEDISSENFYTRLFRRLLGDSLRFRRVMGVGGKEAVLDRFMGIGALRKERSEFYLVDGDFDEMIGRQLPVDSRFYRLPRYDIESFLIDAEAIARVAEEQNPRLNWQAYQRRMDLEQWNRNLVQSIKKLIACFILLHTLGQSPEGGHRINMFVSGDDVLPDKQEIDKYVRNCYLQTELPEIEFVRRREVILEKMGSTVEEQLRWVSGKRIILPMLTRMLKRETRQNISVESLRFRLISYCNLDGLAELRQKIQSLA